VYRASLNNHVVKLIQIYYRSFEVIIGVSFSKKKSVSIFFPFRLVPKSITLQMSHVYAIKLIAV